MTLLASAPGPQRFPLSPWGAVDTHNEYLATHNEYLDTLNLLFDTPRQVFVTFFREPSGRYL